MAPRVYLVVLLLISLAYRTALSACTPPASALPVDQYAFLSAHDDASEPNDYLYIGGVFGVHDAGGTPGECGAIRTRGVHNLEAFLWAVKTYKTRYPGSQLQEVNIGALAFDSCSSSFKVQQQVANFRDCVVGYGTPVVPPSSLLAYVGPDRSAEAVALTTFLGPQGATLVSHAATSAQLADRDAFPRFLRTVPPDTAQVRAIVELLVRQEWKVVQLVYSDNAYGESGRDAFLGAARDAGVCVVNAQVAAMETNMDAIVASLRDNEKTRAVVLFTNDDVARRILQAATTGNTRGLFTWFGTTAWATDEAVVQEVEETAEGAVTLSLDTTAAALQFTNYFYDSNPAESPADPWFQEYWSDKFKCYFPDGPSNDYNTLCDPIFSTSQSLRGIAMDVYVPYTILAVDAILNGIGLTRRNICERSSRKLCDDFLQGSPLSSVYDGVSSVLEPLTFNVTTGSPTESTYTIFNYRTRYGSCAGHCYVEIGDYNTARDEVRVSDLEIYGPTGKRIPGTTSVCGQSPCEICGETNSNVTAGPPGGSVGSGGGDGTEGGGPPLRMRSDGWIIALVVLAGLGILLVIVLEVFLMTKIYATPYVKHWRSMWLGQLLLVAILLSYLTLFAFVPTPTAASCGIIRFAVGVCYAMCFAILLVKLMIILSSKSVGYLKGVFQVLMFFFAWAVQIAADTQWLILHPPGVVPSPTDPDRWVCVNNAFQDHVMSLIYVMVLIVICTVVAIKTHGISTNHREGIFIGLSAGFAIPIWIAWILLGMLIDNPEFQDPCLAFGLFTTTTLIMFNMYLPKVRQLNSMGVEGIYAEDDTPDYDPSLVAPAASTVGPLPGHTQTLATYAPSTTFGYAPSVSGYAPSVTGYAPSKAGSVILIPNGDMYTEPREGNPVRHHKPNPNALYLRHDKGRMRGATQTLDSASVRSAPIYQGQYVLRRPPAGRDSIYATTRVLRMSNELTGRKTILGDDAVQPSDQNENIYYGTARPERSRGGNNGQATLTRANRSLTDLGSL